MNQTTAINIWKQSNRAARLWEELAANCVTPDPESTEGASSGLDREPAPSVPALFALKAEGSPPLEVEFSSFSDRWDERERKNESFIERGGRETIHLLKQALEALAAPPEVDSVENQGHEKDLEVRPGLYTELETTAGPFLNGAEFDPFPAMVKVPFEPEPQPTSTIETRRMYHGLKIPARPLHKRPIYQRVFYCLRGWIRRAFGKSYDPS